VKLAVNDAAVWGGARGGELAVMMMQRCVTALQVGSWQKSWCNGVWRRYSSELGSNDDVTGCDGATGMKSAEMMMQQCVTALQLW